MANGKQLAEQNFQTFTVWLCSRTDDDFRRLVSRGILSRKEIAAQCQFALSVLNQNPRVKAALSNKESELRLAGILPAVADKIEDVAVTGTKRAEVSSTNKTNDNERLRRLEVENASLGNPPTKRARSEVEFST